jgi:hypothetical protein
MLRSDEVPKENFFGSLGGSGNEPGWSNESSISSILLSDGYIASIAY